MNFKLLRLKYIYETLHLLDFLWQHRWLKANITFEISVLGLRKIQSLDFLMNLHQAWHQ